MIKVKATAAKETSVSIGLDTMSAEVLNEFLTMAMQDITIIDSVATLADMEISEVSEIVCGIIAGLDGGEA